VCFGDYVGTTRFAGVEFEIGGQTHYGWLQVRAAELRTDVWIEEWAYESEPGVPIRAGAIPEPSGGVLVVIGGVLLMCRRRKSCPATAQRRDDGLAEKSQRNVAP
jgi:hypothetical protein